VSILRNIVPNILARELVERAEGGRGQEGRVEEKPKKKPK